MPTLRTAVLAALASSLLLIPAAPAGADTPASASKLSKCKESARDKQAFLGGLELRVQRISCAKARKKVVYTGAFCEGPYCTYRVSGFRCEKKTNKSLLVSTLCQKRQDGQVKKVKFQYQTGLG